MNPQDRLQDLLLKRATAGLSVAEHEELLQLMLPDPANLAENYELAAAAAWNAMASQQPAAEDETLPDALRQSLLDDAERFFDSAASSGASRPIPLHDRSPAPPRRWISERLGWAVAATLAVAVVVTNLPGERASKPPVDLAAEGAVDGAVDGATESNLRIARQQLMVGEETLVTPWNRSDELAYASVTGDVVWNQARQRGYMRLTGMPVNDPTRSQYQLWIVDPDRDANPIDGGVFDVPAGADEVIIPIDAKLRVLRPTAFAITREQPGGVVVSAGPLLLVAATGEA